MRFESGSGDTARRSPGRNQSQKTTFPKAARLMGLPVDRVKFLTYLQSGVFAGLAGVILAAQFGAGQPAEGVGWELFSIAAVVVGGTLLTGGVGSVATTLAGVILAAQSARDSR